MSITLIKGKEFDLDFGGWEVDETGVHKGEGQSFKSASPIPIVPVTILTNIDTKTEKVEIAFYKYGHWKNIIVPKSTIASKTNIVKMSDSGIEVNSENARNLVIYLSDVISRNLHRIPRKDAKSVMGWIGEEFAPYTNSITFDGDENYKHLFNAISCKGSLQDWIDFCKPLRENLQMRLMMAASFASPCIELVGENPFVLHMYGKTGGGKTVSLMVAMSIWGDPSMGELTRTMNMTNNSMMATAAFLKNIPFAGDELQTIKNRWANYDQLIMQVTEGIDRGRMSFDKLNELKSWKCAFLFTGEENCVKHGSGGGVVNRVIAVEIEGKLVENGNVSVNFVKQHYGNAGKAFIDVLRNHNVKEMYADLFSRIISDEEISTTDKQAGAMALILLGDELARQTFWPEEEPIQLSSVKNYMVADEVVDASERAYDYLCDAIAENRNSFDSKAKEIWGTYEEAISDKMPDKAYIIKKRLEKVLADGGFDLGAVMKSWLEKGYMLRCNEQCIRFSKYVDKNTYSAYCIVIPKVEQENELEDLPDTDELPF